MQDIDPTRLHPFIVLVGPTGAGKTTFRRRLLELLDLYFFRSSTTRAPRPEELTEMAKGKEGKVDYDFRTVDEFEAALAAGEILESVRLFNGDYYGRFKAGLAGLLERPGIADMTEHGVKRFQELGIPMLCVRITPRNLPSLERIAARSELDAERAAIEIQVDLDVDNDHADPESKERLAQFLSQWISQKLAERACTAA